MGDTEQEAQDTLEGLIAAWAILNNEEITVRYLTRRLNHNKALPHHVEQQYGLFN